ncbi:MAG: hypothetical protein JNM27_13760 [Leptospirales bacterium]|nr:hypothetical protein [Leptospirales bacterium]
MFKFLLPGFVAFLLWYIQIIDPKVNIENVEQYGPFGALWTSLKYYLYTYRAFIGATASLFIVFFSARGLCLSTASRFAKHHSQSIERDC